MKTGIKTVCQSCGLDREVVKEMLACPANSEDYRMAHILLENCPECKEAVK